MVKIGCYVIGIVQVTVSAAGLITGVIIVVNFHPHKFNYVRITLIAVAVIWLIFHFLLLHGIQTRRPGMITAWIIFQCVMFAILLVLCILNIIFSFELVPFILGRSFYDSILLLLLTVLAFFYTSGMVIVHYNFLLEDPNVLDSAIPDISRWIVTVSRGK